MNNNIETIITSLEELTSAKLTLYNTISEARINNIIADRLICGGLSLYNIPKGILCDNNNNNIDEKNKKNKKNDDICEENNIKNNKNDKNGNNNDCEDNYSNSNSIVVDNEEYNYIYDATTTARLILRRSNNNNSNSSVWPGDWELIDICSDECNNNNNSDISRNNNNNKINDKNDNKNDKNTKLNNEFNNLNNNNNNNILYKHDPIHWFASPPPSDLIITRNYWRNVIAAAVQVANAQGRLVGLAAEYNNNNN